jgi:tRNA nucleotidyltransferase (CCA-adding enzyme)
MSRIHVDHKDIVRFAEEKVNLPRDKANKIREQARRVREKVEGYVSEHDDFALRKILISGSLAKGTALRTLNDIDMACYISGADAPSDVQKLLDYLAERLRNIYPNVADSQVRINTYSVTLSFRGTGNDIDVVPIIYNGDPDWYGNLISQEDGSFLKTCIPRHLEFIRKRKSENQTHFAQVVRLANS